MDQQVAQQLKDCRRPPVWKIDQRRDRRLDGQRQQHPQKNHLEKRFDKLEDTFDGEKLLRAFDRVELFHARLERLEREDRANLKEIHHHGSNGYGQRHRNGHPHDGGKRTAHDRIQSIGERLLIKIGGHDQKLRQPWEVKADHDRQKQKGRSQNKSAVDVLTLEHLTALACIAQLFRRWELCLFLWRTFRHRLIDHEKEFSQLLHPHEILTEKNYERCRVKDQDEK